MHPVHNFPPIYPWSILMLSYHLLLCLPSFLFLSGFLTKISCVWLISPMRATCLAHLILINFINIIIFCEALKLWTSSFCSLPQPPAYVTRISVGLNHISQRFTLHIFVKSVVFLLCAPNYAMKVYWVCFLDLGRYVAVSGKLHALAALISKEEPHLPFV